MKKSKGYMMLEVIISIMIILTVVTGAVKAYISTVNVWKRAFITENAKAAIYNLTYEELNLMFDGKNEISLEYNLNTNKAIIDKKISSLNKGDNIKIIKQDDKFEEFLIKCSIPYKESEIILEDRIKKSWWMDEI